MLVKYQMKNTATPDQVMSDMIGIVNGSITSTAQLGAGANTSATQFYGTYPYGTYSQVSSNSTSYTFTKTYSQNNSIMYYVILRKNSANVFTYFSVTSMSNTGIASGGGTVYGVAGQQGINDGGAPAYYYDAYPIDIIVNKNCLLITQSNYLYDQGAGLIYSQNGGVIDIGYDAFSKIYTDTAVIATIDFERPFYTDGTAATVLNYLPQFIVPLSYSQRTTGSSPQSYGYQSYNTYYHTGFGIYANGVYYNNIKGGYEVPTAAGNTGIIEQQTLIYDVQSPNFALDFSPNYVPVYGMYNIPNSTFGNRTVYSDENGIFRYVFKGNSATFSFLIT
jgi:hypothetical protein